METLAELPFIGDQVVCLSHEPGRPQRNAIPRVWGSRVASVAPSAADGSSHNCAIAWAIARSGLTDLLMKRSGRLSAVRLSAPPNECAIAEQSSGWSLAMLLRLSSQRALIVRCGLSIVKAIG
jgi:hypothetical protein